MWIVILFWISIMVLFYTYIGYGILLWGLLKIKRLFALKSGGGFNNNFMPPVTFLVAAYNEAGCIEEKLKNCLAFDYPKSLLHLYFVTDGSNDNTPKLLEQYPVPSEVLFKLFHQSERRGKIAAVNRVMQFVETPITIYSDANTLINENAIRNIVRHYQSPSVGAVAGEKRIHIGEKDVASSAGEGIYWKYESLLKKWDSELNSVVGAAGELFSIRTALFEAPPPNMIVEDFYMTMRIALQGYKVVYEPEAFATEWASASVSEELKRKTRIAAGGFQAIAHLLPALNVFRYGLLSFQYISHRVLRWTLAPLSLLVAFFTNLALAITDSTFYKIGFFLQLAFYGLAYVGYLLEKRKVKIKAFFIPYYFCFMNYAVFKGFFRYLKGNQAVTLEKVKRAG